MHAHLLVYLDYESGHIGNTDSFIAITVASTLLSSLVLHFLPSEGFGIINGHEFSRTAEAHTP